MEQRRGGVKGQQLCYMSMSVWREEAMESIFPFFFWVFFFFFFRLCQALRMESAESSLSKLPSSIVFTQAGTTSVAFPKIDF